VRLLCRFVFASLFTSCCDVVKLFFVPELDLRFDALPKRWRCAWPWSVAISMRTSPIAAHQRLISGGLCRLWPLVKGPMCSGTPPSARQRIAARTLRGSC